MMRLDKYLAEVGVGTPPGGKKADPSGESYR